MTPRFRELRPEPSHLWIRFAPRSWPGAGGVWLDLARGRLGEAGGEPDLSVYAGEPLDDLIYLPPVAPDLAAARDELARVHLARGTPMLIQLLPGELAEVSGATLVVDALPALLEGDLSVLDPFPVGAGVAWPLLAGIGDAPDLWSEAGERLALAGAAWVQAIAPQLEPTERRRLAASDEVFEALFHREPPSDRAFASRLAAAGFGPFAPRPLPGPPIQLRENRRIAGRLAEAAELWLRLGRPDETGQGLFRAARFVDETRYDAAALAREGHLGVIAPLSDLARELITALAAGGEEPAMLAELREEYLGDAGEAGHEIGRSDGPRNSPGVPRILP